MSQVNRQGVLLEDLVRKPVQVEFDGQQHTSDAGALMFAKLDRRGLHFPQVGGEGGVLA